jgi:hypothetical protein
VFRENVVSFVGCCRTHPKTPAASVSIVATITTILLISPQQQQQPNNKSNRYNRFQRIHHWFGPGNWWGCKLCPYDDDWRVRHRKTYVLTATVPRMTNDSDESDEDDVLLHAAQIQFCAALQHLGASLDKMEGCRLERVHPHCDNSAAAVASGPMHAMLTVRGLKHAELGPDEIAALETAMAVLNFQATADVAAAAASAHPQEIGNADSDQVHLITGDVDCSSHNNAFDDAHKDAFEAELCRALAMSGLDNLADVTACQLTLAPALDGDFDDSSDDDDDDASNFAIATQPARIVLEGIDLSSVTDDDKSAVDKALAATLGKGNTGWGPGG